MDWNEYFTYNAETGDLVWKERPAHHFPRPKDHKTFISRSAHKNAGTDDHRGYLILSIRGDNYKVHRIIWEMHNGKIPDGVLIDHIDRNRSNNRIENLRLATASDNNKNCTKRSTGTSGYKGVTFFKRDGTWKAQMKRNGKNIHIGYFATPKEAHEAFCREAQPAYGKFFHP